MLKEAAVPRLLGPRGLLVAALTLSLQGCGEAEPPSTAWAIENVTVIDAVNGVRDGQTVVIDGDRIVSVSPDPPSGVAEIVNGSGRYLIPGLWDMHVHLTYEPALTPAMGELFVAHGVTSVRDTGGLLDELRPVVEALREPGAIAPRVFFSGPLLDGRSVVYDGNNRPEIGTANPDIQAARRNVEALVAAGASFIKIYELVSPEVFHALVQEANARDLPIAAHVPLSMRASEVAPLVDSMEHLRNIELDCAADAEGLLASRQATMAAHQGPGFPLRAQLHAEQRLPAIAAFDSARCQEVLGTMTRTIQVPTLRLNAFSLGPPFGRDDWPEALQRLPTEVRDTWQTATDEWRADPAPGDTTFAAWSLSLIGRMHERGVPIGAGTDTPINYALPGYSLHSELEMLVRAGLSPLDALRAATIRPAEFFGLQDEMGTVEAGKRADLVLLSADPLADITNSRSIQGVVTQGRFLSSTDLDALFDE